MQRYLTCLIFCNMEDIAKISINLNMSYKSYFLVKQVIIFYISKANIVL